MGAPDGGAARAAIIISAFRPLWAGSSERSLGTRHGEARNRQDQARLDEGTGFYYVTKKNPRNHTEKFTFRKYDPVARKHVEFKEAKIK